MAEPISLDDDEPQELEPPIQSSSPLQATVYQNAHTTAVTVGSAIQPVQNSNFGMPAHLSMPTSPLYS